MANFQGVIFWPSVWPRLICFNNAWCKVKFESLIAWVQDFKPIMCLKNVIKLRQKPIGFRLRSKKTQMNSKAKSKMFGFSSACVFQQFSGVRRSPCTVAVLFIRFSKRMYKAKYFLGAFWWASWHSIVVRWNWMRVKFYYRGSAD